MYILFNNPGDTNYPAVLDKTGGDKTAATAMLQGYIDGGMDPTKFGLFKGREMAISDAGGVITLAPVMASGETTEAVAAEIALAGSFILIRVMPEPAAPVLFDAANLLADAPAMVQSWLDFGVPLVALQMYAGNYSVWDAPGGVVTIYEGGATRPLANDSFPWMAVGIGAVVVGLVWANRKH